MLIPLPEEELECIKKRQKRSCLLILLCGNDSLFLFFLLCLIRLIDNDILSQQKETDNQIN